MSDVLGGFEHQVLLAILRLGDRTYSVPIVHLLEEVTGRTVAPAAVYVTLRRLEKRGLLKSEMVAPSAGEGGRERRFFCITPGAVALLRASRREFNTLWDGVEAVEL